MRNIRKNGLNKSLLVCTVLVFAVITLFVVMSVGQQSAIAEAAEHQTNNMTDFFVGPYGKNSFFRADEGLLIRNDDAIVNYIDKTYFTAPCQKLFIGNRYGYFIYTFDDGYVDDGDWVQTGNMRSIVLGFDIDFSPKGQASTKDAFGYKIEIIFQREFVTLMPNGLGTVGLGDFNNGGAETSKTINKFLESTYKYSIGCAIQGSISNTNGLVAPVPQKQGDDYAFEDVKVFYLSDIIVSANIFNAQDLNVGDTGYNVEADNGCFFIGTGFDLIGVEHIVEEADVAGFAIHSADVVAKKIITTVLGMSGPVGTLINSALEIWEYVTSADDYFGSEYFEPVTAGDYYGTKDVPNSKAAQVEIAGGLYRSAAIQMKEASGSSVWLGQNNQYEAIFEVGTSTGNEPGWYTGVERIIDMSVVSLLTDFPTITASSELYTNTFNSLRGKPISEDAASEAYVRGNDGDVEGKDSFAFTAPRNGLYEVSLTNGTGVNYQVKNDVDKTVREPISGGMYYFEEGQKYIIELTNTTSSLKRPTVKVGMATLEADFGDNYTFTLPAGEEMYVKLNLVNPFTRLSVQGTGMKLTGTSDRLDFMLDEMSETAYDISAAKVTFIRIENTSTAAQEGSITFSDIAQITPDGENAVTIDGNSKYFKFVPEAASYIFRYENATGAAVNFTVYSPGTAAAISDIQGDYVLVTGLTAGSVYWIGLYNAYGSDADITLINEAQNGSIQWAINDEVVTGSSYNMYNGQTYDVALMINGEKYYAHIEAGTIAGGEYLTYQNEVLMVANYSSAEVLPTSIRFEVENFIFAGVGSEIIDGLLDVYLKNPVNYIKANGALKIQDTLSHETEVDVTMYVGDPLIEGVDYKVTYTNGLLQECEIVGSAQVVELTDDSLSTFSFDCNALLTYDPLIRITGIVYDGYEYSYSSSDTESSFNILYGKGSGTSSDPYIINCNQHYATFMLGATSDASNQTVTYWKLTEDLDISSFSGGIPSEFYGVFDGGGHTLSGLTIEIPAESFTSDKSYGWFEENYGTIKNVTFSDVTISAPVWHQGAWVFVGTVVGINRPGGVIDNVDLVGADININRNMARIGGIAGVNFSVIKNCTVGDFDSAVNMFGNGDMGAICGESSGTIENCVSVAQMDHYPSVANRSVGGIVGYAPSGSIIDCSMLLAQIKVTGSDANICPNIGAVAGHITSSTVISGGVPLILITLDALSEAQKVNCCTDGSRLYGYMG